MDYISVLKVNAVQHSVVNDEESYIIHDEERFEQLYSLLTLNMIIYGD